MPGTESPIFARSYALLRWLIPLTIKFPREQRFVLAAAFQQSALQVLSGLSKRHIVILRSSWTNC
jgi:hypothetical protein